MSCRRSSRIKDKSRIEVITEQSQEIIGKASNKIGKKCITEASSVFVKSPSVRKRKAKETSISKSALADLTFDNSNLGNRSYPIKRTVKLKGTLNCSGVAESQSSFIRNENSNQIPLPSDPSVLKPNNSKSAIDEAISLLIRVEPKLEPIIAKNPCDLFSPPKIQEKMEPFETLSCSIISQQVSTAAAKSIKAKFITLFNPKNSNPKVHTFPSPSQICSASIETIRSAGLSQRKAEYLKGLAEKFESGELDSAMLLSATYEEVFDSLIKVRGLGKWSIEMFACFGLKKLDVFSTQDVGVQRGMALLLGRDVNKMRKNSGKWKYISEDEMENIANKFKPYRSIFMWYTWRLQESSISALEVE